jgi:hypothetical protein
MIRLLDGRQSENRDGLTQSRKDFLNSNAVKNAESVGGGNFKVGQPSAAAAEVGTEADLTLLCSVLYIFLKTES